MMVPAEGKACRSKHLCSCSCLILTKFVLFLVEANPLSYHGTKVLVKATSSTKCHFGTVKGTWAVGSFGSFSFMLHGQTHHEQILLEKRDMICSIVQDEDTMIWKPRD